MRVSSESTDSYWQSICMRLPNLHLHVVSWFCSWIANLDYEIDNRSSLVQFWGEEEDIEDVLLDHWLVAEKKELSHTQPFMSPLAVSEQQSPSLFTQITETPNHLKQLEASVNLATRRTYMDSLKIIFHLRGYSSDKCIQADFQRSIAGTLSGQCQVPSRPQSRFNVSVVI